LSTNNIEENKLYELALNFLQNMEFEVEEKIIMVGNSGKKHYFDLIAKSHSDLEIKEILVKIIDWKRAVGVDILIRFERVLKEFNGKKGMIISNKFSESAEKFAKRRGLIIYEREHLKIPQD